jgi:hypothetical protein
LKRFNFITLITLTVILFNSSENWIKNTANNVKIINGFTNVGLNQ